MKAWFELSPKSFRFRFGASRSPARPSVPVLMQENPLAPVWSCWTSPPWVRNPPVAGEFCPAPKASREAAGAVV